MRLIDAEQIGLTDMEIIMCDGDYKKALEMLLNKILNAPTIEAEPVIHGRWISHRNDGGHNIADCSECGEALQWYDDDAVPRYCPMCGARMVKE